MLRCFFRCCVSAILISTVLVGVAGCGDSVLFGGKTKDEKIDGMRVTHHQLRLRVRSLINPMTGLVADTADKVIDESDDPEVRLAALRWKANAVPTVRESLFMQYPQIALLDTWALGYQMMDYFETGPGKDEFKDYAIHGYEAGRQLKDRMEAFYADVDIDDDTVRARDLLRNWATQHPIEGNFDSRENITNKATDMSLQLGLSFGEAMDAMVTSVEDLNRKIDVYGDQMPAQLRWEAELLFQDKVNDFHLHETTERIPAFMDTTSQTMEQFSVSLDEVPAMIEKERTEILTSFQDITDDALLSLAQEREALTLYFTSERKAVMGDLNQARTEIGEDLAYQLKQVEASLVRERKLLVSDVEQVRVRLIQDGFRRLLILLALIATWFTILVIGVLWFLNRKLWSSGKGVA